MYVFLHITFYNTIQRQDKFPDCFQTRVGPLLLISTCPRPVGRPSGLSQRKFRKKWDRVSHTYPDAHLELDISYFYKRKVSYIISVTWSGGHYQVLKIAGVHCLLRSSRQSPFLRSGELGNTRNTCTEVMINRWMFHPFVIFLLKYILRIIY